MLLAIRQVPNDCCRPLSLSLPLQPKIFNTRPLTQVLQPESKPLGQVDRLKRRAFKTTETEEIAIAKPAKAG